MHLAWRKRQVPTGAERDAKTITEMQQEATHTQEIDASVPWEHDEIKWSTLKRTNAINLGLKRNFRTSGNGGGLTDNQQR